VTQLETIVAALDRAGLLAQAPTPGAWPTLTGLTADTRKLIPGMLFCAVRGAVEDGHRFLAAAARAGAVAALVEKRQPVPLLQVVVRDGRRAAAIAAETWFGRPAGRLDLVAVTGTNGKTTSVALARHVLSALEPTGSIGTLGAFGPDGEPMASEAGNLTTPGPIDLQETLAALVGSGARAAVMEASSHSLDQGRVEGLALRVSTITRHSKRTSRRKPSSSAISPATASP
jgi:UDP-N-acetylmuramoyl-L-alanyl-D-glutamate--2,6-diaminopimelate ligase